MAAFSSHFPYQPVNFVSQSATLHSLPDHSSERCSVTTLQGEEARALYEEIVNDNSLDKSSNCVNHPKKQKSLNRRVHCRSGDGYNSCNNNTRLQHHLLRSAQEGSVQEMRRIIDSGCDINCGDSYGWTPLMCAAYAGQAEAVQLLLTHHCDTYATNKQGKTAEQLAAERGLDNIVECIQTAYLPKRRTRSSSFAINEMDEHYCDICKINYKSTTKNHNTSVTHMLNVNKKPKCVTQYHIPESNKGFQIMVKSGWDKSEGLGTEGHKGLKFPVKTLLKKDRKGVGFEDSSKKMRVTHFKPKDTSAVQCKTQERKLRLKTVNKRALEKRHRRQKEFEKNFRNEFKFSL